MINLQSNALKFTKDGGMITIVTELIKAKPVKKVSKNKSKTFMHMRDDFSETERDEESENSNVTDYSEFKRLHGLEAIYEPHPEKDKIVISVTDTGVGIKKKDMIKLFKLFGSLQNTRQMNTQGIGLGLVISENIVKAFQGVIGLKSKYGKGTKFAFSILLNSNIELKDSVKGTVESNKSHETFMASMQTIAEPKKQETIQPMLFQDATVQEQEQGDA